METRFTVREREVFTSSALASKIPFTLHVRLKGPMPWEAQVRVMEEPSTTGSGASGVMKGTGKAAEGKWGVEGMVGRERSGRGEPNENMLYQPIPRPVDIVRATLLTCFH